MCVLVVLRIYLKILIVESELLYCSISERQYSECMQFNYYTQCIFQRSAIERHVIEGNKMRNAKGVKEKELQNILMRPFTDK